MYPTAQDLVQVIQDKKTQIIANIFSILEQRATNGYISYILEVTDIHSDIKEALFEVLKNNGYDVTKIQDGVSSRWIIKWA